MSLWQKLFGGRTPEIPYGLHPDNPVLCGGGVEAEYDYLVRLRCPTGSPIQFRRQGSIRRTNTDYLKRPDVKLCVSRGTERRIAGASPEQLPLDAFLIACECGQHGEQIFVDMYFRGREMPIAADGWKLLNGVSPAQTVIETASCPHCGEELRTPQAKQCRHCHMDWHDPDNVFRREPKGG